jgi:hypothetical protein
MRSVKHCSSLLPLLVLCLGVLCAERGFSTMQLAEQRIAPDLAVVSGEFGIYRQGEDDEIVFEKTDTIPLKVDQNYVWRLRVKTQAATVQVREEFKLPAAPKVWDPSSAQFKKSEDNTAAIFRIGFTGGGRRDRTRLERRQGRPHRRAHDQGFHRGKAGLDLPF